MANVKIRLIVDTENIRKKHVDKYCSLIDNTNFMGNPNPTKFESIVDAGSMIEWSGAAKDPTTFDLVSIDSIVMEEVKGSVDLFGVPKLIGSGGVITATVLAKNKKHKKEVYTLNFTVIRNKDGSNHSFKIDPRLKMN